TPPASVSPSHAAGSRQACTNARSRAGTAVRHSADSAAPEPNSGAADAPSDSLAAAARNASAKPSTCSSNARTGISAGVGASSSVSSIAVTISASASAAGDRSNSGCIRSPRSGAAVVQTRLRAQTHRPRAAPRTVVNRPGRRRYRIKGPHETAGATHRPPTGAVVNRPVRRQRRFREPVRVEPATRRPIRASILLAVPGLCIGYGCASTKRLVKCTRGAAWPRRPSSSARSSGINPGADSGVQLPQPGAIGQDLEHAETGSGAREFGGQLLRAHLPVRDPVRRAERGEVHPVRGTENPLENTGVLGVALFEKFEDTAAVVVGDHDGEVVGAGFTAA